MKMAPDEWLKQPQWEGVEVLDPDGWDRKNYAESWAEEIDEDEFATRLFRSTCKWPHEVMKGLYNQVMKLAGGE